MSRKPDKAKPARRDDPPLNFHGLDALGYGDIPLSGNRLADQLSIEAMCFRIGHTPEFGGLGKFGHFKRIVDLLWNNPDLECHKRFVWNSWAEKILQEACECGDLTVAGCSSAGKSDPLALYAVVSYIADPTHTLILQMSTTLAGAKKRIWKTTREYWEAIPELPGKALWGTNEVRGLNYRGDGYGLSSGLFLLASEQSAEAGTLDKLIGIKAPATGTPGRSFEELCADPEYADLVPRFSEAQLRDLLPRLTNLSEHRVGKLILIIDEATGCSPSVLNVIRTNLRPGNAGHFQSILIGNPNSHFDVMGDNATPVKGWSSVSVEDHEWETTSGGKLIRFNGEENPRITEPGGEKYSWMLRREDIEAMEKKYGRNSLFYYRMVLGMWFPAGVESGVYSEADFLHTGSMGHVTWGFKKPVVLAALDPAFTQGGDRASCTFGEYGLDSEGRTVLNRKEEIAIKFDPADTKLPASYQIVRNWKAECLRRGVSPRDAACDVTGSVPFADIIKVLWSSEVLMVNSGGNAPDTPIGEKDANNDAVKASARYANRSTYLWYGAMPFLRSGQVKGVTQDLARQICSRQHSKSNHGVGNKIKIESKRDYKMREKCSPDESDSFFLLVELAKVRRGWSPSERSGSAQTAPGKHVSSWKAFCDRARRLTRTPRLNSLRP